MSSYWDELRSEFKKGMKIPSDWRVYEFEVFFEIETVLYLYETLVPEPELRLAKNAWALLSGYYVPEIVENRSDAKALIQSLRGQIHYVKAASAWQFWLDWYQKQADALRLYQFISQDNFEQAAGVLLRSERILAYQELWTKQLGKYQRESLIAKAGIYHFELDGQAEAIDIPEALERYAEAPKIISSIEDRKEADLAIDLDALWDSAGEVDAKELALGYESPNEWRERLKPLSFLIADNAGKIVRSRCLPIGDFFHLVGALGIGKSTVIWLLVYQFAHREKRHVSIIMNTVVEAYEMARWLCLMGVAATPALGANRAEHARKLAFAHPEIFSLDNTLYQPNEDEPFFRWLPKACAMSALLRNPIPAGKEPCRDLKDETDKKHECPLLRVCSVHQMSRDLVTSRVWLFNPASFLYSRAPDGVGKAPMLFLEAVYQYSDLLIIDEADRVQANWDMAFAPNSVVLGTDDALLDWLHQALSRMTSGTRRNAAARALINRLSNMDDQSNTLANRAYRLLNYGKKDLVQWIAHRQLTNVALFERLLEDLKKKFPRKTSEDEKNKSIEEMREAFKAYWKKPLRRESGVLAEWLNELLAGDRSEKELRKQLDTWLIKQMLWGKTKPKNYRLLCRKLEIAIVLTALIKRINDISYLLPWAEDELQAKLPSQNPPIPESILAAMPEAPLGKILGLRLIKSPKDEQPSFHAMRYQGLGRWLLLNFHELFKDATGKLGPKVLLASATSWLPDSASFHIARPPQAILRKMETEKSSVVELCFHPINIDGNALRVSGAGKNQENNLRRIIQSLASAKGDGFSDFERELMYWEKKGERRRILLLVNSYAQADLLLHELQKFSRWQNRVLRLFPDDAEFTEAGIHTRAVENFHKEDADILIAPLMAIQRGFNILDELGEALLGTAFFLVRPFPPPDELGPQIMSLNAWFLAQLEEEKRLVKADYGTNLAALPKLRLEAQKQWSRRLKTKAYVSSLDEKFYQEFLADSFVLIWQTIGRMIRGGRSAKVVFSDAAFLDSKSERQILHDWHAMLGRLFETENDFERQLAQELYAVAWQAFDKAMKERRF